MRSLRDSMRSIWGHGCLEAADQLLTFKMTAKTIAKSHGLHATFMPKPKEGVNGSGMHLVLSLKDQRERTCLQTRQILWD
mgnify:CR=1 FL=1